MSIYRAKRRGKRSGHYTAEFRYHKTLYRKGGFLTRQIAADWINRKRVKLQRGELDLVRSQTALKLTPLVDEFVQRLRDNSRDPDYIRTCRYRLLKLAREAGWHELGAVTADSFDRWSSTAKWKGRKIGRRTINQYLDLARDFCGWLVRPRQLLASNPLDQVDRVSCPHNAKYRRAGKVEEITALLATTPEPRATFYRFVFYTPIRKKACRLLRFRDLELNTTPPFGRIPEGVGKSKGQKFRIRADVALMLARLKRQRKAKLDDRVFDVPDMDTWREDLKAAGVAFDNGKGDRRLDIHAMRKTAVRMLKLAGVSVEEASVVLGHKSITTTQKFYDDDSIDPAITDAVERMPAIPAMRIAK